MKEITMLYLLWILLISIMNMDATKEHSEQKVLILGGGMAGITAAKTLYDAGFNNFLVLEGSSRIGGRMMETQVADYTVELGAFWIYGKGSNPVYKLAKQSDLSFTSNNFADKLTVRNDMGDDITEAAETIYDELLCFMDMFDKHSKSSEKNGSSDFSVRDALKSLEWGPKTNLANAIEIYLLDFESGVPPTLLSGKKYRYKVQFEIYGSDEMFAINDRKGFAKIVQNISQAFESGNETRVLLNKVVTKIERSKDNVKVMIKDGSEYTADYVIVTFSLGVLQHREVVFDPELPQWKQSAIDKFKMTHFIHLYLQFDTTFWDNTVKIIFSSKRRGYNCIWTNMNIIHPNSNILMLSVLHDDAIRMDTLEDIAIIDELLVTLRSMYPQANVSKPINFAMKRWHSDPLFRGAWSYWPISYTETDQLNLSIPVGRIHFAGEYTHHELYGFVNGAYESGLKTASEVLKHVNTNVDCQTD